MLDAKPNANTYAGMVMMETVFEVKIFLEATYEYTIQVASCAMPYLQAHSIS